MIYLAIINGNTNICENVTSDTRPLNEIILPPPYFAVDLANTPAIDWIWSNELNDWYEREFIGNGGIGDVWNGQKLVQPKPEYAGNA